MLGLNSVKSEASSPESISHPNKANVTNISLLGRAVGDKMQRDNGSQMEGSQHSIPSELQSSQLPDSILNARFQPNDEGAVARLMHDLKVVLTYHVNSSVFLKRVIDANPGSLDSTGTYSQDNPGRFIDEFTKTISYFKPQPSAEPIQGNDVDVSLSAVRGISTDYAGDEPPMGPIEANVEGLPSGATGEVAEEAYDRVQSIWTEFFEAEGSPTPEQHNQLPWPACIGTTGFRSVLCTTCCTFTPPLWKTQLEYADCLISPRIIIYSGSSPALYEDGWLSSNLKLDDFRSFEANEVIAVPVVGAWCRLLNKNWTTTKSPAVCLHILDMDEPDIQPDQIIHIWHCWLVACEVDFLSAELVFIPYRQGGVYGLLVANFKEKRFQQVYCGRRNTEEEHLDRVVQDIGTYFWNFLVRIGDGRNIAVQEFPFEVLTPHWCFVTNYSDSGVVAMHVMEVYSGLKHELLDVPLHKAHYRLRKRVTICARIATSSLNILREEMMQTVAANIRMKVYEASQKF